MLMTPWSISGSDGRVTCVVTVSPTRASESQIARGSTNWNVPAGIAMVACMSVADPAGRCAAGAHADPRRAPAAKMRLARLLNRLPTVAFATDPSSTAKRAVRCSPLSGEHCSTRPSCGQEAQSCLLLRHPILTATPRPGHEAGQGRTSPPRNRPETICGQSHHRLLSLVETP